MGNFKYPINQNGTATIKTAGKYCDRDIDVKVNVPVGSGGSDVDTEAIYQQGFTDGKAEGFIEGKEEGLAAAETYKNNEDWLISGGERDKYVNDRVRSIRNYGFNNATGPTIAKFPLVKTLGNYAFSNNQAIEQVYFPALNTTGQNAFRGATNLRLADMGTATRIDMNTFYDATSLTTVILRGSTVTSLAGLTAFKNTPFAEGGAGGGKIYVPSALIESYKTATNWSALYGYGTFEFLQLEGSEYE